MSCQIALLIDTHVENIELSQLSSISNSISLTAFRLLHFLAAKFEKKGIEKISKQSHTSVKWGFKFFNSRSYVTRIEQHRLRDFKLRYFEEFENEVQRRIENKAQCLEAVRKCTPCECLSKALTELLSDFQWERPDITSPVRGRKKKKEKTVRNFVIIFTGCPKSTFELKSFTGKQVPDFEVFLDCLLPPALYHQFCNVSQLSLNWIDVGELYTQSEVPADLRAVKIVQEALLQANGKLFSLGSVVQCGNPYFCNLASLGLAQDEDNGKQNRDGSSRSTFLLPFTVTLDSFLFHRKEHFYGKKNDYVATFQTDENQGCKLNVRRLSKNCQPSDATENKKILTSDLDLETAAASETSVTEVKLFDAIETPTFQPFAALVLTDQFSSEKGETFVCSELCQQEDGSYSRTGLLEKIIEKIKKRKSCLVVLCKQTKQLAVLEPLTPHTASLWLVPAGKQLWLEKQLLSQENAVTAPSSEACQPHCDSLIQRLVTSTQYKKCRDTAPLAERLSSTFDPTIMDRWHISGCSQNKVFSGLINKLNERINDLDFLSEAEAGALRQLQKAYRQEKKPPGLRDTSLANLDESSQFNTTLDELSKLDGSTRSSKNTSRQSVSRGELMYSLAKSKDGGKEREQRERDTGNVGGKREKPEISSQLCEFNSSEELKDYLTSMYERVLTEEVTSMDTCIQTMVIVVNHYMKQNQSENPEKSSRDLLEECVIMSGSKLREKYSKKSDETDKQEKIIECQCQVLLRLEILSTLINKDQTLGEEDTNDEIVGLLRTLSFISEPGFLSKFMETKILYNYVHTIPKTLANIYDELMQPLPDMLASQLSPDASGDHSDLNSSLIGQEDSVGPPSAHTRSHGSVGPPSSQPGSNRSGMDMIPAASQKACRKLVHHPSLADFGAKRQIVVQKITKPKERTNKKRKRKPSGRSEKDRITKRLFEGSRGGTKLERRQSVAVMERTHKTPKKSKSKFLLKSPKGFMSPRRKIVAETPSHKQTSHVLHRTPGKQRDQTVLAEEDEVVEESPEKQVKGGLLQDTPTKVKRAKALLRRSFYSAGPVKRTRNLTKYFQLADKIAGRQRHTSGNTKQPKLPKLISFEDPSEIKSPSKNSSFLLSQLMSSPSPRKRTPRKTLMSPSSGRRLHRRLGLHQQSPAKQLTSLAVLSSPSSAKKTPRKSVATPGKAVVESPSSFTRSKTEGNFSVPSSNILLSPVSRRNSPRILAADSSSELTKQSPDKTPLKSPVCGTITTGLDSPSQNTRMRTAATPTRRSVRAALFAKSPAVKNINSFLMNPEVSNFQKKLSGHISPEKHAAVESVFPSSHTQYSASKYLSFMSPQKRQNIGKKSPEKLGLTTETKTKKLECENKLSMGLVKSVTQKEEKSRQSENVVFEKGASFNFGLTPNSKQGPTIIQRTPSPSKKQKSKTPDSFDKWHRRKPRSSQSSPVIQKNTCSPQKLNDDRAVNGMNSSNSVNIKLKSSEAEETDSGPLRRVNSSRNKDLSFRRKRSLIPSPEQSCESPSKRQRTSRTKSLRIDSCSSQQNLGSQGFDITGSFSEFSQNSAVSSVDYFSASNNEVFLSQDDGHSPEDVEMEDIENNSGMNLKVRTLSQSSKGWFSPRHRTLDRITSSEFSPSRSHDQRSESPVFGSSKKVNRNCNISDENMKLVAGSESLVTHPHYTDRESPTKNSPGLRKSPGNKKYSPVVSAKSLMHLIQSPLLTSPKDDDKNSLTSGSPRNHKGTVGDRSRRSLKLHN